MSDPSPHLMELVQVHGTGWEEYYCPVCARRFIVQFAPDMRKILLDEGAGDIDHIFNLPDGQSDDDQWLGPYRDFLDNKPQS